VCFWEDDLSQLRWPTTPGSNGLVCLIDGQRNYRSIGRATPKTLPQYVRPPREDEQRPADWRPIDLSVDDFEQEPDGTIDMGRTYPTDNTVLYYWSDRFWCSRRT
jgi:hypothetical protein